MVLAFLPGFLMHQGVIYRVEIHCFNMISFHDWRKYYERKGQKSHLILGPEMLLSGTEKCKYKSGNTTFYS